MTAKIRWLPHAVQNLETSYEEGRPRWIHCTPLLGASGSVGIWMIVIVDEDKHAQPNRRFRQAPPVATDVRRPHHAIPSGTPRELNSRMDDLDLTGDHPRDDYGYTNRVASPSSDRYSDRYSDRNGAAAHRNITIDAMRSPSNSRRTATEQRVMGHSSSNSLRENKYGHGPSVDSFHI